MGALHFRTNCCRQWFKMGSFVCSKYGLVPDRTQHGRLPPWEVAKAIAYSTVITDISEHLGQAANELIGERVDDYIAKKLKLVGGGSPTARAVRHVVARNRNGDFYPGKPCENPRGRKRLYTEHQSLSSTSTSTSPSASTSTSSSASTLSPPPPLPATVPPPLPPLQHTPPLLPKLPLPTPP